MDYEPVRVAAPDHLVAQVDGVTGRRYTARGGGMYEMHPRDAAALVREGGFKPGVSLALGGGGYICPGCGFRAVVRRCSRCGGQCETREERIAKLAAKAAGQNQPEVKFPPVGEVICDLTATVTKSHVDNGVHVIDEIAINDLRPPRPVILSTIVEGIV